MDDSLLKLGVDNLQELLRLKELNNKLLDVNHNLLDRNIQFCKKHGIPLEQEGFEILLAEIRAILEKIADQPTFYREKINRQFDRTRFVVLSS